MYYYAYYTHSNLVLQYHMYGTYGRTDVRWYY